MEEEEERTQQAREKGGMEEVREGGREEVREGGGDGAGGCRGGFCSGSTSCSPAKPDKGDKLGK